MRQYEGSSGPLLAEVLPYPVTLTNRFRSVYMRVILPFAALAFALSIATAYANEAASDETAGRIAVVDESTLVLEDGATFTISESVSIEGLEPGTEVIVSFEELGGQIFATKIAPSN
jgi:hypothetical protein